MNDNNHDDGLNWRGYLPGLFNRSWLFVARHLLMMCYYKREWHILVLTLHIFNSFAINIQKTADWKVAKLTQSDCQCSPLLPESVEEFAPFTSQYGRSLISAPLLVWVWEECSSQRKETLHLYDARGQMGSLGNRRQVGAYLLLSILTESVINNINWYVPSA